MALFFARFIVLYGAVFTPISHGNHTDLAPITCCLHCWLGLLEVFTDELAIGSEDHFHVFVTELARHVPRVGASGQHGGGVGVPDLVGIPVLDPCSPHYGKPCVFAYLSISYPWLKRLWI